MTRSSQIRFLVESELLLPYPGDCPRSLVEKFTKTDTEEVERIARAIVKDKLDDEHIVKIVRNVLVQLYKTFYTRRSFWTTSLNANPD